MCEQCGSISIVQAQPRAGDTIVAFFTGKRPFLCRRCGWRARRRWSDLELDSLRNYGAGGAEIDPALSVLDEADAPVGDRKDVIAMRRREEATQDEAAATTFDPGALDFVSVLSDEPSTLSELEDQPPIGERSARKRHGVRKGRGRVIGREIVVTIAVTSIIILAGVALSTASSCVGFRS